MDEDERTKRMQRVLEKYERGETVTLDEFLARRGLDMEHASPAGVWGHFPHLGETAGPTEGYRLRPRAPRGPAERRPAEVDEVEE